MPAIHGVNLDASKPAGCPPPAVLAAAGVKAVRFGYQDASTDFSQLDPTALARYTALVHGFRNVGIHPVIILGTGTVRGFVATDVDPASWAAYAHHFAERAGLIAKALCPEVVFEIWNEEDNPSNTTSYAPGMPAQRYGPLLRDAYASIKAVSPATVISGGADSGHPQYLQAASAASGGLHCDGVGLHPYAMRPTPVFPTPTWGYGTLAGKVTEYAQAIGKPVYVTEWGVNSAPIQAEYLALGLTALNALPMVPMALWFCWSDAMVAGYGLVDAAGHPKPAATAFLAGVH